MNFNELTKSKHEGKNNLRTASSKKKYIISGITGIIIGGLIFGGIGVAAVTLTAKQITYTPSNSEFNATNAEEALNKLYEMGSNIESIIYLGQGTSFNVTSYEGYQNFTADNFIVEPISAGLASVGGMSHKANYVYMGLTLNKSYSNGVLSASVVANGMIQNAGDDIIYPTRTFSVKAYLVLK